MKTRWTFYILWADETWTLEDVITNENATETEASSMAFDYYNDISPIEKIGPVKEKFQERA